MAEEVPERMENQLDKNKENDMETEISSLQCLMCRPDGVITISLEVLWNHDITGC